MKTFGNSFRVAHCRSQEIAEAFGGIAIHSCGGWAHTMGMLGENVGKVLMIDCAVDHYCDPNPNKPEEVRDALKGSGIIAKTRMGKDMAKNAEIIRQLAHPDLSLIVQIDYDEANAANNYLETCRLLESLYA